MRRLRSLWDLLATAARDWQNDDAFRFSAALSYYAVFSLTPIMVIAVGVASMFLEHAEARQKVIAQIQTLAGPQGGAAIEQISKASERHSHGVWAIAIGIITLVIGATGVFVELQADLNRIWDVQIAPERQGLRKMLRTRLAAFILVLVIALLLLLSFILTAVLAGFEAYAHKMNLPGVPWMWQAANLIISFFVISLLFAAIYRFLPDVYLAWKDAIIGGAVTSFLFTIGKYFVGLYLGHLAIMSRYGAAGAFVLLLVWIYYVSLICLFGAEFTQAYARCRGRGIRPSEYAIRTGHKSDAT